MRIERGQVVAAVVVVAVFVVIAIVGVSLSSGGHSSANGPVPIADTTTTTAAADADGLVPAENPRCNFGSQMLHYLKTGDNGGDPWYDQHFSSDVGESLPEARADTDKAIQDCDKAVDAEQASAAESSSEAAQESRDNAKSRAACEAVGMRYEDDSSYCESWVTTQVPMQPAGTNSCALDHVDLDPTARTVDEKTLAIAKSMYPGCFPTS